MKSPLFATVALFFVSCATVDAKTPLDGNWTMKSVDCVDGSKTELLAEYQAFLARSTQRQTLEVRGYNAIVRSTEWDDTAKKQCHRAFRETWELKSDTYRTVKREPIPVTAGDACVETRELNSGLPHHFTLEDNDLKILDAKPVKTVESLKTSTESPKGRPFCQSGTLVWSFVRQ